MKRKAGSLKKPTQTKVLKASPKAQTKSPAKATKRAPPPEEYSSSDDDIGDINEYMQGESDTEASATIVEFDDGEVTLNLPQKQKKSQLFDSDEEGDGELTKKIAKLGNTKFSDENNNLLRPKRATGAESDEGDEEDEDDDLDEEFERRAMKIQAKKMKEQQDVMDAEKEIGEQAKAEEEESEAEEDIQDVASRMENLHGKIQEYVGVLTDFKERRPEGVSREEYVAELKADLMIYFGYTEFLIDLYFHLFTPAEVLSHIEANEVPRPLTIRTNTLKSVRKELAQTLINKGVSLEPVKWSKVGLVIYESKIPIGATPEYLSGQYMLQSAASFLPVLALDPQANEEVLDMCAAPGGKTTYISALMKNTGCVHANDKNPERIPALVANVHRMGVKNCVISELDGCVFPSLPLKFDRVLLDAPCMGLGVIAKDRSIKSSKDERDMLNCIDIQIKLLLAAIDSVDISKAAVIVYSTCSISVEENEAIVDKALKKRFVKVVDTGLEFGKEGFTRYRGKVFHPSLKLSRRYYPHAHNIDGFYVCKLHKFANGIRTEKEKLTEEQEIEQVETRGPLVLKKNAVKLAEGKLVFEDDAKSHIIDQAKEEQRSQKSKEKRANKKQNRQARMRANAQEGAEEDEPMDDAAPPKQEKPKSGKAQPTPNKAQTTPNKANGKSTPAANGTKNTKGATPQKKLRGSKQ